MNDQPAAAGPGPRLQGRRGDLLRLLHRGAGRRHPHRNALLELLRSPRPEQVQQARALLEALGDTSLELALLDGIRLQLGRLRRAEWAPLSGRCWPQLAFWLLNRQGGPARARIARLELDLGALAWRPTLGDWRGLRVLALLRAGPGPVALPPLPQLQTLVVRGFRLERWPSGLEALPALRRVDLSGLAADAPLPAQNSLPQVTVFDLLGLPPAQVCAVKRAHPGARVRAARVESTADLELYRAAGVDEVHPGAVRTLAPDPEQAAPLARHLSTLRGRLRLAPHRLDAASWDRLVGDPALQELHLESGLPPGLDLRAVHPGLQSLTLERFHYQRAQLRGLERLTRLHTLSIHDPATPGPQPAASPFLLRLLPLQQLRRLSLCGVEVGPPVIALALSLPRLERLDLRQQGRLHPRFLLPLAEHPTLREVVYEWARFGPAMWRQLAMLKTRLPLARRGLWAHDIVLSINDEAAPFVGAALRHFPAERLPIPIDGSALSRAGLSALPETPVPRWSLNLSGNTGLGAPDLSLLRHLGAHHIRLPGSWSPLPVTPADLDLLLRVEELSLHAPQPVGLSAEDAALVAELAQPESDT